MPAPRTPFHPHERAINSAARKPQKGSANSRKPKKRAAFPFAPLNPGLDRAEGTNKRESLVAGMRTQRCIRPPSVRALVPPLPVYRCRAFIFSIGVVCCVYKYRETARARAAEHKFRRGFLASVRRFPHGSTLRVRRHGATRAG